MTVAIRFLLSLLICLALPAQAEAAFSVSGKCPDAPVSTTKTTAVTKATAATASCMPSGAGHSQSMNGQCKASLACSPPVLAFHMNSSPSNTHYQRFRYPRLAVHFILQDFPRTLLRPPSLA